MLYFGGEEIPLIQACEVFFFSLSEVSVPDLPIAYKSLPKSCFEVRFCYYLGVMCPFPALILVIKLRFLNKVCLMHIM